MTGLQRQRARRPMSYDTGPCEGWQASPSNPTKAARPGLSETVVLRCTTEEKRRLKLCAESSGLSMSELLRGSLGLIKLSRRRPAPKADPTLIAGLSRLGANLNQIARAMNTARVAGAMRQLDALEIAASLVSLDRQLGVLLAAHTATEGTTGESRDAD